MVSGFRPEGDGFSFSLKRHPLVKDQPGVKPAKKDSNLGLWDARLMQKPLYQPVRFNSSATRYRYVLEDPSTRNALEDIMNILDEYDFLI